MAYRLKAAVVYQSLRLAAESLDRFEPGQTHGELKDSIQTTLIRRVFKYLD